MKTGMRKKVALLSLLMVLVMVALTGCGPKKHYLNGSYEADFVIVKTQYEFTKDSQVTVKVVMGSLVLLTETGTYEFNEDQTEITMTFDPNKLSGITGGENVMNGTYSYTEGEGYIQIGKVQYSKMTE